MAKDKKMLRSSTPFVMKHNDSGLYLKEIINLPFLSESERIN